MSENYPENEVNVISTEEAQGIDMNQVDSIQLKDGTVVVVQDEGEGNEGEEYDNGFEEEGEDQICDECTAALENQSYQLRARPMMVHPMRPPVGFAVPPKRPVIFHPMGPRGPVRQVMPIGRPVFRMRPGAKNIGYGKGGFGPQQGGFGPGKQQGGFGPQQGGFGPGKQQGGFAPQQGGSAPQGNQVPSQGQQQPNNPTIPASQPTTTNPPNTNTNANTNTNPTNLPPLINQQIMFPNYNPNQNQNFKARPNRYEEEYQEEEYAGEEYNENNEQYQEGTENQLRARPMLVPGARVVAPPRHVIPPYGYAPVPKVVPYMPGMGVKRGPVPRVVAPLQPRFRGRPGVHTFQPKVVAGYGYGGMRPTSYHHHRPRRGFVPPPPIFRSRPRSNSFDERNDDEQMYEGEYQCDTCVCSKCGKEF